MQGDNKASPVGSPREDPSSGHHLVRVGDLLSLHSPPLPLVHSQSEEIVSSEAIHRGPCYSRHGALEKTPWTLYLVLTIIFSTIGGFLFGYDTGIIGGVVVMDDFRDTFGMPRVQDGQSDSSSIAQKIGWVVASLTIGCIISSSFAGTLTEKIGRKYTVMSGAAIFTCGAVLQAASSSLVLLIAGRVASGLGIGILSVVVPMFAAELAPRHLRGRLGTINQLAITFGIVVAFVVNIIFNSLHAGWRYSLSGQAFVSGILFAGAFCLPESPRWLVIGRKDRRAQDVLNRLRLTPNSTDGQRHAVEYEFNEIKQSVTNEIHSVEKAKWRDLGWSSSRPSRGMRLKLAIGVGLQAFQQLTGINAIMYYAPLVFSDLGIKALVATAVIGVFNFLATFLAIWLVDRAGRRILLLLGALGMFLTTFAVGLMTVLTDASQNRAVGYTIVGLMCLFVVNFAYSWGPICWIIPAEVYPSRVRGKAMSISTAANWVSNFAVAMITPIILSHAGIGPTFFTYAGLLLLMLAFTFFTIPETRGVSLEAMDRVCGVYNLEDYRHFVRNLVFGKRPAVESKPVLPPNPQEYSVPSALSPRSAPV